MNIGKHTYICTIKAGYMYTIKKAQYTINTDVQYDRCMHFKHYISGIQCIYK